MQMDSLVSPSADLEELGDGFGFVEGPIWTQDRLYFSDIPNSRRHAWDERSGITVISDDTNKGNGMDVDADGRLYVCEQATSVVSRFRDPASAAEREIVASHHGGKELNSPNDVVCARDGSFYFTDPLYGRVNEWVGLVRDPELTVKGVYRVAPDAAPTQTQLLADDFEGPNGLCFSPDGRLLYVNDTPRKHIRVFDVLPGGALSGDRVLIDISTEGTGSLDGMECDEAGNVWVTGPGGIWAISPTGEKIGVIPVPIAPGSLAWGGTDFDELFITARTTLFRIKTKIAGHRTF